MSASGAGPAVGEVVALASDDTHRFSKSIRDRVRFVAGVGIDGDAHAGGLVQHLSRVRADPTQPNLRQVHLIGAELLDELADAGMPVEPGRLGENVLTRGVDLLGSPVGTFLQIGSSAIVALTGLRNPCGQLNDIHAGLLDVLVRRDGEGNVVRRAGVMGVVVAGGDVSVGDQIRVTVPQPPHRPLDRV